MLPCDAVREQKLLEGFKAIAGHLGMGERQVKRLAKGSLPVWGKGRIVAYSDQLDFWIRNGRRPLEPQTASIASNVLTAYYDGDYPYWTHRFPAPFLPCDAAELAWRVQMCELVGQPGRCVLVASRFAPDGARGETVHNELFCFSAQGGLLWSLPAEPEILDRDGSRFPHAWRFKDMLIDPPGESQSIWLAFGNEAGWAGCVLRVSPKGDATVQFANAGYVERLCRVTMADGDSIIACGENNNYERAFVASFKIDDLPASSPVRAPTRYRFANTPGGAARRYILFPRTELIKARDKPYGHAYHIEQYDDRVIIVVDTGGDGGDFRYHFSEALDPLYVFPSGSHEFLHRSLERAGRVNHPWETCPEVRRPLTLQLWESEYGWRDIEMRWRDTYPEGYS